MGKHARRKRWPALAATAAVIVGAGGAAAWLVASSGTAALAGGSVHEDAPLLRATSSPGTAAGAPVPGEYCIQRYGRATGRSADPRGHPCPRGGTLNRLTMVSPGPFPSPSSSSISPSPGHSPTPPSPLHSPTSPGPTSPGPTSASPSPGSSGGQYFGLAPLGTSLPRSDAYCAQQVQPHPERIAANTTANHDVPPAGTDFHWGQWAQRIANFTHVDGNFSGTTDEILEWAACKWGWGQDYAKAEAVVESSWHQSVVGDNGHSFGILQVRAAPASQPASSDTGWGGYPWTQDSTALDADAQMAYLRACYDGNTPWLGIGYHAGDAWGCIGSWFSGNWLSAAADAYIAKVQAVLASHTWESY